MKKCPNGHEVADNLKYCPTCGAEIISGNKFCTKCGSERKGTEKFCSQCGTPFDAEYGINHIFNDEKDNSIKKYLPYIIGAVVLLGIIGVFASRSLYGSDNSKSVVADSMAVNNNAQKVESDAVISDYDERLIYQGEYEFDAVLTDATLEKKNSTFTIKIDGNKVSVPMDEGKVMSGHIYSDDLGIDVVYDYGDDLHFVSMSLKPNDKEGKEWVGEYQPTGLLYNVVLKLKEIKHKGEAVKVTEERKADNDSETIADDNSDDNSTTYSSSTTTSSSSRTFQSEQLVIGYLANQSFRASDGLTMRVDGDGRLYVDGDYAGVLSVLRYSSTAALLRYGGGMYGEGKLTVNIVGDKFTLTDPTDGTEYYQR